MQMWRHLKYSYAEVHSKQLDFESPLIVEDSNINSSSFYDVIRFLWCAKNPFVLFLNACQV